MPPAKRAATKRPAAKRAPAKKPAGLTVAVTGPTGDIGRPLIRALERARGVDRIIGMARRPFDPAAHGWRKAEYRRGDILVPDDVEALVADADVVVHLAFVIMGDPERSREIDMRVAQRVRGRGHGGASGWSRVLGGGVRVPRGQRAAAARGHAHPRHRPLLYSAHKAEVEQVLDDSLAGSGVDAYVFRPCIVAGPESLLLIENLPFVRISGALPGAVRNLLDALPVLKPVLPDPGVPFQLVHADDVASAIGAAVAGRGEPGVYNLAGDGELTVGDLADALGWYSIPLPELALGAAAEVIGRLPFMPPEARWIETLRVPVLMDTSRARSALRWRPKHDAMETLRATVEGARADGLL